MQPNHHIDMHFSLFGLQTNAAKRKPSSFEVVNVGSAPPCDPVSVNGPKHS